MAPFEPFTAAEIIEYLTEHQCRIRLKNNAPELIIPDPVIDRYGRPIKRAAVRDYILPHLIARKAEVLEYLDPDAKLNAARRARSAILSALAARSTEANRPIHWFGVGTDNRVLKGYAVRMRRGLAVAGTGEVPPEATFACVEGDETWTALPNLLPASVPKKAKRRKRKKVQWTGG